MRDIRKIKKMASLLLILILISGMCCCSNSKANSKNSIELLNVSYDPTRELYEIYNKVFEKYYKDKTGKKVVINQSHGGSGSQARSVIDGLDADVVTLGLGYDVDSISKSGLIDKGWEKELKNNSCPYTSTIVFLVRKGNPKKIEDWNDLLNKNIQIIMPNPKSSGAARWDHLAAYAYFMNYYNNDEEKTKKALKTMYSKVLVWDTGARGATTTFTERGQGDVLVSWENEALRIAKKDDNYEIVVPSISVKAEPSVAVVDKVVKNKNTKKVAEDYLKYLYSKDAQKIIAENYYRPIDNEVAEKYSDYFPKVNLVTINDYFGGWDKAYKYHFTDGGLFDEVYAGK